MATTKFVQIKDGNANDIFPNINTSPFDDSYFSSLAGTRDKVTLKPYFVPNVTSIYDNEAAVITNVNTNFHGNGHIGHNVVTKDGKVYRLVTSKIGTADTTSAQLIATGMTDMLIQNLSQSGTFQVLYHTGSVSAFRTICNSISVGTAANNATGSIDDNHDGTYSVHFPSSNAYATSAKNGGTVNAITLTSAQYATSAKYCTTAANGGVTQIGVNAPITKNNATGAVTIGANLIGLAAGYRTAATSHATDLVTQSAYDELIRFAKVTSIYATDAAAVTGAGTIGAGHLGDIIAGATSLYKVVTSGTGTSAQAIGVQYTPFFASNNVASQNAKVFGHNGTKYVPLITSVKLGTKVAGTAGSITDNNDGTVTVNYPSSNAYATSAKNGGTAGAITLTSAQYATSATYAAYCSSANARTITLTSVVSAETNLTNTTLFPVNANLVGETVYVTSAKSNKYYIYKYVSNNAAGTARVWQSELVKHDAAYVLKDGWIQFLRVDPFASVDGTSMANVPVNKAMNASSAEKAGFANDAYHAGVADYYGPFNVKFTDNNTHWKDYAEGTQQQGCAYSCFDDNSTGIAGKVTIGYNVYQVPKSNGNLAHNATLYLYGSVKTDGTAAWTYGTASTNCTDPNEVCFPVAKYVWSGHHGELHQIQKGDIVVPFTKRIVDQALRNYDYPATMESNMVLCTSNDTNHTICWKKMGEADVAAYLSALDSRATGRVLAATANGFKWSAVSTVISSTVYSSTIISSGGPGGGCSTHLAYYAGYNSTGSCDLNDAGVVGTLDYTLLYNLWSEYKAGGYALAYYWSNSYTVPTAMAVVQLIDYFMVNGMISSNYGGTA